MGDIFGMIINLQGYLPSLTALVTVVSWLIGILMVIKAIRAAAKRSEVGLNAGSWTQPMVTFGVGVAFIALPSLTSMLSFTLFQAPTNTDPASIFAYAPSSIGQFNTSAPARTIILAMVSIIRFLGLIGVMRGLYLMNRTAVGQGGPQTFGPGLTFLIGGAFAMNFQILAGVFERLLASPAAP